jgi:hypothetical protein
MVSNLDCIGLGVCDEAELDAMLARLLPSCALLGVAGDVEVRRWQDASGARLVIGLRGGEPFELVPSYAGSVSARLGGLRPMTEDVLEADVVDEQGETLTRAALELEERRFLAGDGHPGPVPAVLVALGTEVSLHRDAGAFGRSASSLVGSRQGPARRQGHVRGAAGKPMRLAAESFLSYGLFGDPGAYCRLHGTVVASDVRENGVTGREFFAALVRCAGFEVTLCTPREALAAPPEPGNVLGGTVFLVGSAPSIPASG